MSDEWENEPEAHDFTDDATGYLCALRRGPGGHWCGYIQVPTDHPWHGKSYSTHVPMPKGWADNNETLIDEIGVMNVFCAGENALECPEIALLVRCHGGLTYSGSADWIGPGHWFGFDCAHAGDLCPKYKKDYGWHDGDIYRNMDYVIDCCRKAAGDIKKFEKEKVVT